MRNSLSSNNRIKRSAKNSSYVFDLSRNLNYFFLTELCFDFQKNADKHNENLAKELKIMFENKMLNGFGKSYLNDDTFINLFMKAKMDALKDVSLLCSFKQIKSTKINAHFQ